MIRVRTELRASDIEIAKLQSASAEASQKHLAAMDARPEVAAARAFVENVDKMRAEIDKRARVLRKAILAKDPECKAVLNQQTIPAGLALVGEGFWNE